MKGPAPLLSSRIWLNSSRTKNRLSGRCASRIDKTLTIQITRNKRGGNQVLVQLGETYAALHLRICKSGVPEGINTVALANFAGRLLLRLGAEVRYSGRQSATLTGLDWRKILHYHLDAKIFYYHYSLDGSTLRLTYIALSHTWGRQA